MKIRVLASRELSNYELREITWYLYLATCGNCEAAIAAIEYVLNCKRCSIHMIPDDGFDGTLRCDCGGDSMREYTVTWNM